MARRKVRMAAFTGTALPLCSSTVSFLNPERIARCLPEALVS